jgi:isopenicillin N synthase-like dioxygenase
MISNDDDPETPNLWLPESTIPGFRAHALAFYDEAWKIAAELLRAVALGLDLEHEDDLVKLHSKNGNILSFRHYPPVDVAKAEELRIPRMAAHRDFSPSITLLFQDQCGGLEVLKPRSEGEFIHVTPIEGTFVMNIGDVLMRWSNGIPSLFSAPILNLTTKYHQFSISNFSNLRCYILLVYTNFS